MAEKDAFSLKLMERILKEKGALRVSKEAKKEMSAVLKENAEKIAFLAVRNALHLGRKTILAKDIKNAIKKTG